VGYHDLIELARSCLLQASAARNPSVALRQGPHIADATRLVPPPPERPSSTVQPQPQETRERKCSVLTLHAEAPVIVRRAYRSLGREVSYLAQIGRGDDATVPNGKN
jgi:hypothetical protein